MRKSQIILATIFLVFTGAVYFVLRMNQTPYSKEMKEESTTVFVPVRTVKNGKHEVEITSYGQITPNTELMVTFEVQGKLIQGSKRLKPGTKFSQGEILYKVDNEEAYYSMNARKSALANMVLNALPEIELEYPSEKDKWIRFMRDLDPSKLLPELPVIRNEKERMFISSRNIFVEYYNLKSTEARLAKYIYAAPFSGTVVSINAEPGAIVGPGIQIAKIAKTGDFEVKVPIDMDDLALFQGQNEADFYTTEGELIGKGKIIRISDVINQSTQSLDVYFSISPVNGSTLYNGTYVNVSVHEKVEKETMLIPRIAVSNNKVNLLDGGKVIEKDILIVGTKPDSVYVTGLKNGTDVILERQEKINPKATYKGIQR
ncbi:MAG: efflux RND transporter periplasmic adaptor subunit [Bacteroidetes bacterium]|nr:MAG: efflux RND transporter periplasmic adaptor subunit [Bacteroidota bacterium]